MKNFNLYIIEKLNKINKDSKVIEQDPKDPYTWLEGDVLAGNAGYSMQLPRFYIITKKLPHSLQVTRIKGKIISGHRNGQWEEVPDEPYTKIGDPITARIKKSGYIKADGIYVHLWDGKPLYGDDMD